MMMTYQKFFAEAARLNCRMVSDDPAKVRAAFDAKDAEIERLRAALVLAEAALADIGDGEGPVYDRISKVNRSWSLYQAEKRALQALPTVRDALAARDDNLIQSAAGL